MTTTGLLCAVHFVCGLIVLAEALNKLERTDIFDGAHTLERVRATAWLLRPWRWSRPRVVIAFKLTAWMLLAVGAAGEMVGTLRHLAAPRLPEVAVLAGFALLIVRSRLKEG